MGRASHDFLVLYNLYSNPQVGGPAIPKEFAKYLVDSMQMPGENPAGVWIANRKPIQKMKARLKEGESEGKNCKALISFLEKKITQDLRFADPFGISFRKLPVESDFNVGKSSAKMTAVSLVAIIFELSGFYEAYDGSCATDDCIKACWEAWEIMEFVENSDTEAAFVNKQADRLFHRLKESRRWLGIALPINSYNSEDRSVEAVKRALQCLAEKAEQMAGRGRISSTGYDSKNWEEIIGGNSMYNLCESIKMRSDNIDEILNFVQNWLADIIGSCVLKVEKIIMEKCRLWAETFMEEELWDAFYLAGKARGVSRQLPLEFTSLPL